MRERSATTAAALLGIAAGVALERALLARERHRPDPEAAEPLGTIHGTPATVTSPDGTRLHVEELDRRPSTHGRHTTRWRSPRRTGVHRRYLAAAPGSGTPCLLLVHGFSLDQHAWHYQRRDLPGRFRCVLYDQRGHGRSGPAPGDDYSLDALAADLAAVIEWTGARRLVVVGHSLGGMAALRLAAADPDLLAARVAGLVLVSSTYDDALLGMSAALGSRGVAAVQRAVAGALFQLVDRDPLRAHQLRRRGSDLSYLVTRVFGFGPRPSPSQVLFVDRLLARTPVDVWVKVVPSVVHFDLAAALARIPVPTLVATGDRDRLTPLVSARRMAATIPGGRLLVLEGAGHAALLEAHASLNEAIAAFVEEVG